MKTKLSVVVLLLVCSSILGTIPRTEDSLEFDLVSSDEEENGNLNSTSISEDEPIDSTGPRNVTAGEYSIHTVAIEYPDLDHLSPMPISLDFFEHSLIMMWNYLDDSIENVTIGNQTWNFAGGETKIMGKISPDYWTELVSIRTSAKVNLLDVERLNGSIVVLLEFCKDMEGNISEQNPCVFEVSGKEFSENGKGSILIKINESGAMVSRTFSNLINADGSQSRLKATRINVVDDRLMLMTRDPGSSFGNCTFGRYDDTIQILDDDLQIIVAFSFDSIGRISKEYGNGIALIFRQNTTVEGCDGSSLNSSDHGVVFFSPNGSVHIQNHSLSRVDWAHGSQNGVVLQKKSDCGYEIEFHSNTNIVKQCFSLHMPLRNGYQDNSVLNIVNCNLYGTECLIIVSNDNDELVMTKVELLDSEDWHVYSSLVVSEDSISFVGRINFVYGIHTLQLESGLI